MEGAKTVDILKLVDELEDILNEAKSSFMSAGGTRKIVDAAEMIDILNDIRDHYPEEVARARRVVKERDELLEAAQTEAGRIIEDAKAQAVILASEQEVARLAQQQANEIMDDAREYERETRFQIEDYCEQLLTHVEDNLLKVAKQVTDCRERFNSQVSTGPNSSEW